jgi:hypothetical protein
VQKTYTKGDLLSTISSITNRQVENEKRAAAAYNVLLTTLRDRRARRRLRRNCEANVKRLTKLEEEIIIHYILEETLYRFPSLKVDIQDIANKLLRE